MHLILDLDGTLIDDQGACQARPYLKEFLDFCFTTFETVSIWTTASRLWFNHIYQLLLAPRVFTFVYCEDRCTTLLDRDVDTLFPESIQIKPLKKVFQNRSLPHSKNNTFMVDDTPETYCRNYGNAIPITTFQGSQHDRALLDLMSFLSVLLSSNTNVRSIEKRYWSTNQETRCL